jgi:hypothetical protein
MNIVHCHRNCVTGIVHFWTLRAYDSRAATVNISWVAVKVPRRRNGLDQGMSRLKQLLARFAKRKAAWWWMGPTPDVRTGKIARSIAAQLGYPSGDCDPFSNDGMTSLDKRQAAYVLALAGTRGLAYYTKPPSKGVVDEALDALNDLSGDAVFLSNGVWGPGGSRAWNPLSSATFDCGVIGYDGTDAFIFWVEDYD